MRKTLPNAVATLVLGICSIVTGCLYLGLILGIVGLAISGSSVKLYRSEPDQWDGFGMLNAGRIMSIIGIVLSSLWIVWVVLFVAIIGVAGVASSAYPFLDL